MSKLYWRVHVQHEKMVKRAPLLFNSVYYGGVYCASDISQQLIVTPLASGEPRQKFKPDSVFRCWVGRDVLGLNDHIRTSRSFPWPYTLVTYSQ